MRIGIFLRRFEETLETLRSHTRDRTNLIRKTRIVVPIDRNIREVRNLIFTVELRILRNSLLAPLLIVLQRHIVTPLVMSETLYSESLQRVVLSALGLPGNTGKSRRNVPQNSLDMQPAEPGLLALSPERVQRILSLCQTTHAIDERPQLIDGENRLAVYPVVVRTFEIILDEVGCETVERFP